MPQKKNPDSLELLRGKSGRIFGNVSCIKFCVRFYEEADEAPGYIDGRLRYDLEGSSIHIQ